MGILHLSWYIKIYYILLCFIPVWYFFHDMFSMNTGFVFILWTYLCYTIMVRDCYGVTSGYINTYSIDSFFMFLWSWSILSIARYSWTCLFTKIEMIVCYLLYTHMRNVPVFIICIIIWKITVKNTMWLVLLIVSTILMFIRQRIKFNKWERT